MTMGQMIGDARRDRKLSQVKLAKMCGISLTCLKKIEEDMSSPNWFSIRNIAFVLDLSLDELAKAGM